MQMVERDKVGRVNTRPTFPPLHVSTLTRAMMRYTSTLLAIALTGCGALGSAMYEPALDDRKLTVHVLRSQSREAQRMIAELRAEVEASKQTLALSQVAHARLQGQLREVERRYGEARQIVDLQREELARLRDEREVVLRTSRQLQNQMSRLQRQIAGLSDFGHRPAAGPGPVETQHSAGPPSSQVDYEPSPRLTARNAGEGTVADPFLNGAHPEDAIDAEDALLGIVVVQPGDTLWKISRRYKVSFPALRSLNGLDETPDLIFVGQELLLPE